MLLDLMMMRHYELEIDEEVEEVELGDGAQVKRDEVEEVEEVEDDG